jgi:S1-C subfamily serine protease
MRVVTNSPAAEGGVRRGDVIIALDDHPISNAEQLQQVVEDSRLGQVLRVKVQRGNKTQNLLVTTAELQNIS